PARPGRRGGQPTPHPAAGGPAAAPAPAGAPTDASDRALDVDELDTGPTLTASMRHSAHRARELAGRLIAPQEGVPNLAATWALGAVFLGSAILLLALAVLS
ncbi:MAG: hypothetical protein JJT89_17785, partial [Nitriliruptoraceae bacterium]|nr:hypothetical protein [Nitriliruptoraceae bacterium]